MKLAFFSIFFFLINGIYAQVYHENLALAGWRYGNIQYTTSFGSENRFVEDAVARMCYNFCSQLKYSKLKIDVFINFDYRNKKEYSIEYFEKGSYYENEGVKAKRPFVKIFAYGHQFNRIYLLKLLDFTFAAFKNRRLTKCLNKDNKVKKSVIDSVLSSSASAIMLHYSALKLYRPKLDVNDPDSLYYVLNDTFVFPFIKLTSINQILSSYYLGYLIFDSDTSLYFYNLKKRTLGKHHFIKNRIEKYDSFRIVDEDENLGRIEFEYYESDPVITERKKKYLFLTDKDILIQNFDKLIDKIEEEYSAH
jgi:hypothetical protein